MDQLPVFRFSVNKGRPKNCYWGIWTSWIFLEADRACSQFQKIVFVCLTINISSTPIKGTTSWPLENTQCLRNSGETNVIILGKFSWLMRRPRPLPNVAAREQGMPCLLGKGAASTAALCLGGLGRNRDGTDPMSVPFISLREGLLFFATFS